MIVAPVDLYAPTSTTAVSTLVSLSGWIDVSLYENVVAGLHNTDASTAATMYIEFSQFGTVADADTAFSLSVAAATEGSREYVNQSRRYIRLSAESASGTIELRGYIRGIHRWR